MRPLREVIIVIVLLGTTLSAWVGLRFPSNPSAPTEADARADVEQDIKDFSQGCIKLVDFQKTGEQVFESVMLVNATARIEFLEDCNWPFDTMVVALKTVPGDAPNVRKGEQRTANLTLQFHKTDRGWKTRDKRLKKPESNLLKK